MQHSWCPLLHGQTLQPSGDRIMLQHGIIMGSRLATLQSRTRGCRQENGNRGVLEHRLFFFTDWDDSGCQGDMPR